jgi:hypothetical protein
LTISSLLALLLLLQINATIVPRGDLTVFFGNKQICRSDKDRVLTRSEEFKALSCSEYEAALKHLDPDLLYTHCWILDKCSKEKK